MTTIDQKTSVEYSKSRVEHLQGGIKKENLISSEQKVNTEDISKKILIAEESNLIKSESESAIVESQLQDKKKTWIDKFSFLNSTILTTQLYQIMDQESTSREKDLKPFWNQQSKEISKKLWLPTKIDCVDSVLTSSKESLKNIQMGKSWFSIKKKHPLKKNSLMTSFQLSQFSHPDCMDLEATQLKIKSEPKLKTLKIRLLPSSQEKKQIQLMLEQSRWYYNTLLECFNDKHDFKQNNILKKDSYSFEEIREFLSTYDYREIEDDVFTFKYMEKRPLTDSKRIKSEIEHMFAEDKNIKTKFEIDKENQEKIVYQNKLKEEYKQKTKEEKKEIRLLQIQLRKKQLEEKKAFHKKCKEENTLKRKIEKENMSLEEKEQYKQKRRQEILENKQYTPEWWRGNNSPYTRIARGSAKKLSQNINSVISNFKNGNINNFEMKFMSKKKPIESMLFEDKDYPSFIRNIKSRYWFTDINNKKKTTTFSNILKENIGNEKGCEIIYEKSTDRYFLHYPVEYDFFPEEDRRNDSQVKYVYKGKRIISLDPGVRKFMVGYDPSGTTVFFGQGANKELIKLLLEVDKKPSTLLWKKIKDMVNELHCKTVSFLVENYDVILLPDFRVSQMIKSKRLTRMTKRLMCMYSFHSFKQKLAWKCSLYNKKLFIVDESFTSKTCGRCGILNDVGGNEVYECTSCRLICDRDVSGARNIFIKNLRVRYT